MSILNTEDHRAPSTLAAECCLDRGMPQDAAAIRKYLATLMR
jgi:hypothetical protein